ISEPGGLHFLWKTSTVGEDLTVVSLVFVEDQRYTGRLDNLERSRRNQHRVGNPVRQAASRWTILTEIFLPVFVESRSPRLERNFNAVGGNIVEIFAVGVSPEAG